MPIALLSPAWLYVQSGLIDLRTVVTALALIAAAAAMLSPRGRASRRAARTLFFVAMLVLAAVGADLAVFDADPNAVIASVLIGYLTATAWASARRSNGGVFDVGGLLIVAGVATVALSLGLQASGAQALTDLGLASFAGLAGAADLRLILGDGISAAAKSARARWRAGSALTIAATWFVVEGRDGRLAPIAGSLILGVIALVQLALWVARGRRIKAPAVGEAVSLEPR